MTRTIEQKVIGVVITASPGPYAGGGARVEGKGGRRADEGGELLLKALDLGSGGDPV
jgi:hypothetical protein